MRRANWKVTSADSKGIIRWPNNPRAAAVVILVVCHPSFPFLPVLPFSVSLFCVNGKAQKLIWQPVAWRGCNSDCQCDPFPPLANSTYQAPSHFTALFHRLLFYWWYALQWQKPWQIMRKRKMKRFVLAPFPVRACLHCLPVPIYPLSRIVYSVCRVPRASGVKSLEKSVL